MTDLIIKFISVQDIICRFKVSMSFQPGANCRINVGSLEIHMSSAGRRIVIYDT